MSVSATSTKVDMRCKSTIAYQVICAWWLRGSLDASASRTNVFVCLHGYRTAEACGLGLAELGMHQVVSRYANKS